jgi:hypothetical protein
MQQVIRTLLLSYFLLATEGYGVFGQNKFSIHLKMGQSALSSSDNYDGPSVYSLYYHLSDHGSTGVYSDKVRPIQMLNIGTSCKFENRLSVQAGIDGKFIKPAYEDTFNINQPHFYSLSFGSFYSFFKNDAVFNVTTGFIVNLPIASNMRNKLMYGTLSRAPNLESAYFRFNFNYPSYAYSLLFNYNLGSVEISTGINLTCLMYKQQIDGNFNAKYNPEYYGNRLTAVDFRAGWEVGVAYTLKQREVSE